MEIDLKKQINEEKIEFEEAIKELEEVLQQLKKEPWSKDRAGWLMDVHTLILKMATNIIFIKKFENIKN